jgi:hypothetical protein
MNDVITETIRVDNQHAVRITDDRLIPGEEVEVIVRPRKKMELGFLETALSLNLDLPADYSIAYEAHLKGR